MILNRPSLPSGKTKTSKILVKKGLHQTLKRFAYLIIIFKKWVMIRVKNPWLPMWNRSAVQNMLKLMTLRHGQGHGQEMK